MTLKLQRVNLADFELMSAYKNAETGDLVAPGIAACWPSPSSQRTQFSIQRELSIFHNDASVCFVKIVNKEGELLCLGRWHFYDSGYPAEHAEFEEEEVVKWPEAFNHKMYGAFMKAMAEKRWGWQDRKTMWVLTTLVTREPFRRHRAGGLIVEWGVQQALKDDCPAYLEAAASAISLYTFLGFRLVEEIKLKLDALGATGEIMLASMAANL